MSLAGIILAAGASRRMGSPKALLDYEGQSFLDRLIELFARHCDPVVVALGHHAEAVRNGLKRADQARFVINPDPDRGMLTSLQCALRGIPGTVDGVLFTPVDHPAVSDATIAKLTAAFAASRPVLVVPRFEGRHGHPVGVAAALVPEFLKLPLDGRASDVIHSHAGETLYVDVDGDAGIVTDVDRPEDYQRLLASQAVR